MSLPLHKNQNDEVCQSNINPPYPTCWSASSVAYTLKWHFIMVKEKQIYIHEILASFTVWI